MGTKTRRPSNKARRSPEELLPAEGERFATRTRVDTGGWLWKSRLVACVCRGTQNLSSETGRERDTMDVEDKYCVPRQTGELVLFAAGKRPFVEKVPFAKLRESFYNHVTGEVALSPAEGARVRKLRMSPVDGRALLKELGTGTADERPRPRRTGTADELQ